MILELQATPEEVMRGVEALQAFGRERQVGEKDLFGNVYKGKERPYTPASFQAVAHRRVGGYALQIDWADRHNDGIYSWDTLRQLAESGG